MSPAASAGRDQLPTAVGEADRYDVDVLADDGGRARELSVFVEDVTDRGELLVQS